MKIKILSLLTLTLTVLYTGVSYYLLWSLASKNPKPVEALPDNTKCDFETVTFKPRGEDFKLEGWFLTPKTGCPEGTSCPKRKSLYTLIFVHGIATNRISNEHTLNIAYDFVKLGFNVLMFDQRTQGNSEGDFASGSYYEKFDVLGAFDFLIKEKDLASEEIGLLGFSMGGATSVLATSIEPKLRALAVDSPFSDARKLIAQETASATGLPYGFAKVFVPMVRVLAELLYKIDLDDMVPEEAVKKISFPIFLIHGDSDRTLSHQHSKNIHKNAHKGSQLHIIPKGEHTSSYHLDRPGYIKRLYKYYLSRMSSESF